LWAIDLESGISRIDELLEYCKQLRSSIDVQRFLGMTGEHTRNYYLNPLIKQGRLRKQTQGKGDRKNVFYLNTAVDLAANIGDAIAQYCETPRLLKDIARHFGLEVGELSDIMKPIISSGKLAGTLEKMDAKETRGKSYKKRYFMSELAMRKKGNAILEFCSVPRSRPEIEQFLGAGWKYYIRYLQPLIDGGKLSIIKPDQFRSVDQRFVATDNMDANTIILSEATLQEYCRTPRTRAEMARHFEVKTYIITRGFLDKMIKSGKLKMTNELYPQAQTNGYFHPETEVIVLSEKSLTEFCETPRTRAEITRYFDLSTDEATSYYLQRLMRAGVLFGTRPQGSHDRKFTSIAPIE
jgi:hypothetical protein